jgi:hypothetical protein
MKGVDVVDDSHFVSAFDKSVGESLDTDGVPPKL